MPNTYTLISSNLLASNAASVTFSAIPSTFTDLVLRVCSRGTQGAYSSGYTLGFNGGAGGASWTGRRTFGYDNTTSSDSGYGSIPYFTTGTATLANTFSSDEIYISNYLNSTLKPFFGFHSTPNNATTNWAMTGSANLWSSTSAISSLSVVSSSNFVSGSSFYLYGIKNS
jgi:hypothetical protein